MKHAFDTTHLSFNEDGWGYLPPSRTIRNILEEVLDIANPYKLLEIGFYMGHSTSYFAELDPMCEIISCCPDHPRAREFGPIVEEKYKNVKVIRVPSPTIIEEIPKRNFDLVFIDGNHNERHVIQDSLVAMKYNPEYILYDNYEQYSVRRTIDMMVECGSYELEDVYRYDSYFKGKLNHNAMVLVKNKLTGLPF